MRLWGSRHAEKAELSCAHVIAQPSRESCERGRRHPMVRALQWEVFSVYELFWCGRGPKKRVRREHNTFERQGRLT